MKKEREALKSVQEKLVKEINRLKDEIVLMEREQQEIEVVKQISQSSAQKQTEGCKQMVSSVQKKENSSNHNYNSRSPISSSHQLHKHQNSKSNATISKVQQQQQKSKGRQQQELNIENNENVNITEMKKTTNELFKKQNNYNAYANTTPLAH